MSTIHMDNLTQVLNRQQYQRTFQKYMQPAEGSIAAQVRQETRSLRHNDRVNQAKSFWFNPASSYDLIEKSAEGYRPEPQSIYFGDDGRGTRPTWEIKCFDFGRYNAYLKSQDASTNSSASHFDSLVGLFGPEIQESAYGYLRSKEAGGVITSGDFSNIQLLAEYIDILNVTREYSLLQAVTQKATNTLAVKTLAYNKFGLTESLGELEAPESRKGSFTSQTFSLQKFGSLIAFSDEAELQNWSGVNPIDYTKQNLGQDAARIRAKKVATALATLATTGVSLSDFSAWTGEHSTANPLKMIQDIFNEIYANGGNADSICSTPRTYSFFSSNTYITSQMQMPYSPVPMTPGQVPAKGLPGFQWWVDNSLVENYIYVFDKRGIWYLTGPSRISQFRDELAGMTGVIYREWGNAFVKESGFGKKGTSIAP